jgi:DNA-binding transcriptional ArsR family regulator
VSVHAGDNDNGIPLAGHPAADTDGGSAVLGAARPEIIDDWAELFQALSDTNRLRILLAVHHSPGICVADLAEAVGMTANATSHALGALRLRGIVRAERSGRERRWRIASNDIHNLLHQVGATHSPLHPDH